MAIQDINPSRFTIDPKNVIPTISQVNTNPLDIRPTFQGQAQYNQNITTQLQKRRLDLQEQELINGQLDGLFDVARKATKRSARQTVAQSAPATDFSTYGLDPNRAHHQQIIGRVQGYFTKAEEAKSEIFNQLMSAGQPSQSDIRLASRAVQQLDTELNQTLEQDRDYSRAVNEHAKFVGFVDKVGKSKGGLNTYAASKAIQNYNKLTGFNGATLSEDELENLSFLDEAQYSELLAPIDSKAATARIDQIGLNSLKKTKSISSTPSADGTRSIEEEVINQVNTEQAKQDYKGALLSDPQSMAYLESTLMVGYNSQTGLSEQQYFDNQLNTFVEQKVGNLRNISDEIKVGQSSTIIATPVKGSTAKVTTELDQKFPGKSEQSIIWRDVDRKIKNQGFSSDNYGASDSDFTDAVQKGLVDTDEDGNWNVDKNGNVTYSVVVPGPEDGDPDVVTKRKIKLGQRRSVRSTATTGTLGISKAVLNPTTNLVRLDNDTLAKSGLGHIKFKDTLTDVNLSVKGSNFLSTLPSQFGDLTITSALRSGEQNAAVGGVARSFHKTGDAMDIRTKDASGLKMAEWSQTEEGRNQLLENGYIGIWEDKGGENEHLHLEPVSRLPDSFTNVIAVKESGGASSETARYKTIYKNGEKKGGEFEGLDVTTMTIDEIVNKGFTDGLGKFQIIPDTLNRYAKRAGIKMTDKFTPKAQNKIAEAIFKDAIENPKKGRTKVEEVKFQWKGLKSTSNEDLFQMISDYESGNLAGGIKEVETPQTESTQPNTAPSIDDQLAFFKNQGPDEFGNTQDFSIEIGKLEQVKPANDFLDKMETGVETDFDLLDQKFPSGLGVLKNAFTGNEGVNLKVTKSSARDAYVVKEGSKEIGPMTKAQLLKRYYGYDTPRVANSNTTQPKQNSKTAGFVPDYLK